MGDGQSIGNSVPSCQRSALTTFRCLSDGKMGCSSLMADIILSPDRASLPFNRFITWSLKPSIEPQSIAAKELRCARGVYYGLTRKPVATEQRCENADETVNGYWCADDRRYPKRTAVQPVARLVKWRFGVGTTLCVPVLLYVPNARAARRVDGRVRRFPLLPPSVRAKHPNWWWGPGNTDIRFWSCSTAAVVRRLAFRTGWDFVPSSSSRLRAASVVTKFFARFMCDVLRRVCVRESTTVDVVMVRDKRNLPSCNYRERLIKILCTRKISFKNTFARSKNVGHRVILL